MRDINFGCGGDCQCWTGGKWKWHSDFSIQENKQARSSASPRGQWRPGKAESGNGILFRVFRRMDRPGVRQVPEGSGEQGRRKVEMTSSFEYSGEWTGLEFGKSQGLVENREGGKWKWHSVLSIQDNGQAWSSVTPRGQ